MKPKQFYIYNARSTRHRRYHERIVQRIMVFADRNKQEYFNDFIVITAFYRYSNKFVRAGWSFQSMEHFLMPTFSKWEFVEIRLQQTAAKDVEKYAQKHKNDPVSILEEITSYGYKVSISWVDDRNAYVVSVSGSDNSKNNNQTTVTSWSDSAMEALAMAGYKVVILTSGGDWKEFVTAKDNWG